jgi:hydrogenase maturation protein HypF
MNALETCEAKRLKLTLRGAVQGVGFRPFVFRLATELGLRGWINNSPQGVFIEVEGAPEALQNFITRLEREKPPRSFIQCLESSWLDAVGFEHFEIRASENSGDKTALVLPDIATCPDCLREIFDPQNRRYLYPFTNCTHCGPRFSIIESLPYDRANTSMKDFPMCPECEREYHDPRDRRFHAQPNACPVCGPHLEFWERGAVFSRERKPTAMDNSALIVAAKAIRRGQIVAVKGIGGFHLLADAANERAINLLRKRKHREEKPFALMFPSLESVKSVCEVSPLEERLLLSSEAPIVLLKQLRTAGNEKSVAVICEDVAPANPNLGVMLPSNPLHHLLMAMLGFPVVATSGNLSDEPICTDEFEALERLHEIADAFLVHNRPIVRHVDDSIARVMLDREMILRRARGFAPLPIQVRSAEWQVRNEDRAENNSALRTPNSAITLAVGAHLKNSIALAVGENIFLSQHIGDLETEQANNAFGRVIGDFQKLYDATPEIIAADLHPDYFSTQFADKFSARTRKLGVQHHVAHVLSCMAENELAPPALGVAWDGTGLGADGTIWGGEFFLVTQNEIKHVAHLRPFRLPGGDAAVKEPRRVAIGLLHENFGDAIFTRKNFAPLSMFSKCELSLIQTMLNRKLNSSQTSSVGRLFDAVASLVNLRQKMRFEGQAAMDLEFAIGDFETDERYELSLVADRSPLVLDWSKMLEAILADVNGGISVAEISAKFHNALAEAVVKIASRIGEPRVALSGGCFQNRYLLERTVGRLREENFQPYWHQRVPTNDGGIALGQIAAAIREQQIANRKP